MSQPATQVSPAVLEFMALAKARDDAYEHAAQLVEVEAAVPKLTALEMHRRLQQIAQHIRDLKRRPFQPAPAAEVPRDSSSPMIAAVRHGADHIVRDWEA